MNSQLCIIVYGHVQGVLFRVNTISIAQQLGLTGWVRNCEDGESVEIIAEGEKEKLEKLLEWCAKGPAGARVDSMEKKWQDYSGKFKDFGVRY